MDNGNNKTLNTISSQHFLNSKTFLDSCSDLTVKQLENLISFISMTSSDTPIIKENQPSLDSINKPAASQLTSQFTSDIFHWINRIKSAVKNKSLLKENAILLLTQIAKITTVNGKSILHQYYIDNPTNDKTFKKIINPIYDRYVTIIETKPLSPPLVNDKNQNRTILLHLIKNKSLRFKGDGTVDKRCSAYKKGLVDDKGNLLKVIELSSVTSSGTKESLKSCKKDNSSIDKMVILTQYKGVGRPRKTDYTDTGFINRINKSV